ncbi:DUF6221 family protein [Streptomyces sp. NPDC001982]|uniref:DUF6221 family protein n=1 Tax=unclassified Streptomyces TaxID=2593676 RepID=UPI00331BCD89
MDELVQWLGEQLDEDERIAQAAPGPTWEHRQARGDFDVSAVFEDYVAVADPERNTVVYSDVSAELLPFALRHDPARVLREIDSKRRMVARYEASLERSVEFRRRADVGAENEAQKAQRSHENIQLLVLLDVVKLLALPYADRPGYRNEWRP